MTKLLHRLRRGSEGQRSHTGVKLLAPLPLVVRAGIVLLLGYGFAGGFWPLLGGLGIQAVFALAVAGLILGALRIVQYFREHRTRSNVR